MGDQKPDTQVAGPVLTHIQTVNRQREITAELERLEGIEAPTAEEESYFDELRGEFFELDEHRKKLERRAKLEAVREIANGDLRDAGRRAARTPAGRVEGSTSDWMDKDPILNPDSVEEGRFKNPWDLRSMSTFDKSPEAVGREYKSRALSAIEQMQGATERVRSAATDLIEQFDDGHGSLSRLALALSEPVYMRAWSKMARRPTAPNLDSDEQQAIARVEDAARAMSLTDGNGGYLVPFQIDPSVIITSAGSLNQIRQIARSVVATGDVWHGVSAGAVSWSYDAEGDQVSDDAPSFGQPTVPVYTARGFVPISMEALQDEQNVTQEVGRLLAFGKDTLEAQAFATGSGSGQPTGIVTALLASSPSVVVPSTGTNDTISLDDAYAVLGALPARYRSGASWLANNLYYNELRQLDGASNQGIWSELSSDRPARLLGKAAFESESMDGTVTGSGENYMAIVGDFSNYVIADRIGTTVEFIPHLFGANQRPTGQRGWFASVRHGADSVNDGAFRMLNVT